MIGLLLLTSLAAAEEPTPAFASSVAVIPQTTRDKMVGVTWREGCPVGLDDLSLVTVSHWDPEGAVQSGQLIVATAHAENIAGVFRAMFEAKYPLTRVRPAHEYGGSDDASMAADNTSAFNCRAVTGGTGFSEHSYGHAIDVNPLENPYVVGQRVLPPEGAPYIDRAGTHPALIVDGGPVVAAFDAIGWGWGGRWTSVKDYQHFSYTGR